MLAAATKASAGKTDLALRLKKGILWITEQMNQMAGRRDDALHAPLQFMNIALDGGLDVRVVPADDSGSPRAASLMGRPLLQEFKWYHDHLNRLASYAVSLHWAYDFAEHQQPFPWPDTPAPPTVGQYRRQTARRRRKNSK